MDSPELWGAVGVALAGIVLGVVRGIQAKRNGKQAPPPPQPQQTIVRVDGQEGVDPAEDTGRFMIALQQAPSEDVRAFTRAVLKSIEERPAMQGDVKRWIDEGITKVRGDINGHFQVTDAGLVDVRRRLGELPCQRDPDGDCDEIKVEVEQ